jgi:uncharacterized membrane protein YdcZ (DUF606 family)
MTIGRTPAIVLTACAGALMATPSNVNGRLGRGVGTLRAGYHALDATRIAGVLPLVAGTWLILRH